MNCFLTLVLSMAAMGTAEDNVIGYWPMDPIKNGLVRDASGNGLDAAVAGEMPDQFIRTGVFGDAGYFDNTRNRLVAPSSEALGLRDEFTISCAIYPLSVDGFRTILWKGDRTLTPEAINYYVDVRDGKLELKAKDAEGRWLVYSTAPVVVPDAWHLLEVTYNAGGVRMWVNGEECLVHTGENGQFEEGLLPNDGPLTIGCGANSQGLAYGFLGLIDDVKIQRGVSGGPSEAQMGVWREAVQAYPRRLALSRLASVCERVRNVVRTELPAEEVSLLRNLERKCEEASQRDVQGIDEAVGAVRNELDRLAYRSFYRANGGEQPFLVIPLRTSDRVVKRPRFFEDIGNVEAEVALESARNEYEGFQIVITPGPDKALNAVSVEVSNLQGPGEARLDQSCLGSGWIRPAETETPDIPVAFTGWIPDAIIEGEGPPSIEPYDFECVYVRVFVPHDAIPGDYRGVVTVKADGETREIGIRMHVYAFALPKKTPLKMAFSFFEQYYEDWYGLESVPRERQRALYEFLLDYRIPPNNIYTSETTYPDLDYLKAEQERMTFFTYATGLPNPGTDTAEGIQESIDRIAEVHAALERENLLDDAYFYCFDELAYNANRIPEARRFLPPLRERIPGIRVMQTSFPEESIRDLFNVWCPIIYHFDRPEERRLLEQLRAEGNEIWWYMADAPQHPFPNLFLDYPPFDARILGILSFMYDVEGVLYWSINREWKTNLDVSPRWPDGEWKAHIYHMHTGVRKRKNGMGNLVYPGPDGRLYPSLRLENLRDGVEDHTYLTLLREFASQPGSDAALAERARDLLAIPPEVAHAASNYNPEPEALLDYRHRIGELLGKVMPRSEATR